MKTLKILAILSIGFTACLTLPACTQTSTSQSTNKLVLTGSSTVAPLAAEIARKYEETNPEVRIDVQTGGSSRGIADARSRTADIGMVSRTLTPEETDLTAHTIAQDGVSLILNAKNPVQSLTNQQVIDIYTDKINNWQEVGGNDAPITVVNKSAAHSTLGLFLDFFGLEAEQVFGDVIIGDNEQGIKTVAGNPNAIGYVSIGAAEYHQDAGTPIQLLPVDGIIASTDAVSKGIFPLSRPLNFVTLPEPSSLAQDFIQFAQSSQIHDTVEAQYFVPVSQ
jgi:phosphate transport system substrate-binding protein